jgi:hypothetical protein
MAGCRSPSSRLFSSPLLEASDDFGDARALEESPPLPESRLVAQELCVLIVGGVIFGEASGYRYDALEDGREDVLGCCVDGLRK